MEKCKPFPIEDILYHIKCNKCRERESCWDGWHYPYGYTYSYDSDGYPTEDPTDDLCCYFTPYLFREKCESEDEDWCAWDRDDCPYYQKYIESPNMCVENVPYYWCHDREAECKEMDEHYRYVAEENEREERIMEEKRRKFPFLYEKIDENRKRLEEFNTLCLEELIEKEKRSNKSGSGLNGIKG